MIITKKALPRRTFLRGHGRDDRAAIAGCHGSLDDRAGGHTCQPGPPPGVCLHADGRPYSSMDSCRVRAI